MFKNTQIDIDGSQTVFTSGSKCDNTLAAFLAPHVAIDRTAMLDFLLFGSILPPHSPLEGVEMALLGEKVDGPSIYEHLSDKTQNSTLDEFVDLFDEAIGMSVQRQAQSRSAVLLSGGIDSAILLSYLPCGSSSITWGGWGKGSSDILYSRKTAEQFSVGEHIEVTSNYEHDEVLYRRAVRKTGLPLSFKGAVPMLRMAEAGERAGISHWFMGQNADTLMLSYATLDSVRLFNNLNRYNLLTPFFRKLTPFIRRSFLLTNSSLIELLSYYKSNGLFPSRAVQIPNEYFKEKNAIISANIKTNNFSQRLMLIEELLTEAPRNQILQHEMPRLFNITASCPFYDEQVIKLALSVPDKVRRSHGGDKVILRQLARKRGVPEEVIQKGKKGLSYGYAEYFSQKLHLPIWDEMEQSPLLQSLVDISELRRRSESDPLVFDRLRSLWCWEQEVAKRYNLDIV